MAPSPSTVTVRKEPRFVTNIASSVHQRGSTSKEAPEKRATSASNQVYGGSSNALQYPHAPFPKEPPGIYDAVSQESDLIMSNRKFVKVNSYGEVEMEPDIVEFCIKITTNKTEPTLAKESVKKRKDFILACMQKFRIPDQNVSVACILKRVSSMKSWMNADDEFLRQVLTSHDPRKDKTKICFDEPPPAPDDFFDNKGEGEKKICVYFEELCVKCDSLAKYLKVFSICNEKLDHHVELSRPFVRFSPLRVKLCTQRATQLAMANAEARSQDLISTTKQRLILGRLHYSVEESLEIVPMDDFKKYERFETFAWKRLNKLVQCSLSSVFELEYPKVKKIV